MSDPISSLTLAGRGESMVDRIEHTLSDAIRRGELPGGLRLREIPIAERFDCSTTPVREAIRRLAAAGLVVVLPRRGATVSSISVDGIDELYELRFLLEPAMARKAAANAQSRPDLVAQLRDLVELQERQEHDENADGDRLDATFHATLARLAGNETIADHVANATQRVEAVQARAQKWTPKGLETALHFHAAILDAVVAGDADLAEQAMKEHLAQAKRGVLAGLGLDAD